MHVSLRYKQPAADVSQLMTVPVKYDLTKANSVSGNFRLATAVAEFGLLLVDSKYKGNAGYLSAKTRAEKTLSNDAGGYRKELVELIDKVLRLKRAGDVVLGDE
jgi:Ca-activated chloride channel family protein